MDSPLLYSPLPEPKQLRKKTVHTYINTFSYVKLVFSKNNYLPTQYLLYLGKRKLRNTRPSMFLSTYILRIGTQRQDLYL